MKIDYSDEDTTRRMDDYIADMHRRSDEIRRELSASGYRREDVGQATSGKTLNALTGPQRSRLQKIRSDTRDIIRQIKNTAPDPAAAADHIPVRPGLTTI